LNLTYDLAKIRKISDKYHLREMALFGSAIRDDFNKTSDVDVMIEFLPDSHATLFDIIDLKIELERLFQRPVDLVEKKGIKNPFRKKEILSHTKVIYEH
jgi:uncharacterized protein